MKFLLDLEQISFKYFAISFVADSIIMSWYLEHNLEINIWKKLGEGRSTTLLERRYLQNYSLAHKETFDSYKANI